MLRDALGQSLVRAPGSLSLFRPLWFALECRLTGNDLKQSLKMRKFRAVTLPEACVY